LRLEPCGRWPPSRSGCRAGGVAVIFLDDLEGGLCGPLQVIRCRHGRVPRAIATIRC
jgi:hypothetical protein